MVWPHLPLCPHFISCFFLFTSRLVSFFPYFLNVPSLSCNDPGVSAQCFRSLMLSLQGSPIIYVTSCSSKTTVLEGIEVSSLITTSFITIFLTAMITISKAVIYLPVGLFSYHLVATLESGTRTSTVLFSRASHSTCYTIGTQ